MLLILVVLERVPADLYLDLAFQFALLMDVSALQEQSLMQYQINVYLQVNVQQVGYDNKSMFICD